RFTSDSLQIHFRFTSSLQTPLSIGRLQLITTTLVDLNYCWQYEPMRELYPCTTISHMLDLGCMYGFITNYRQTIFLRQIQVSSTWRIEHSAVIKSSVRCAPPDPTDQSIGPVLTFNQ
ncbi:hypothetical protein ACN38_g6585, partial [Penicillium nordicum]